MRYPSEGDAGQGRNFVRPCCTQFVRQKSPTLAGRQVFYSTSPVNDHNLRYLYKCRTSYKLPIYDINLRTLGSGTQSLLSGMVFTTQTAEEIESTYHELKSRGVHFALELVRHDYGKGLGDHEARFVDPDGNEFLLHTVVGVWCIRTG